MLILTRESSTPKGERERESSSTERTGEKEWPLEKTAPLVTGKKKGDKAFR